MLKMTFRVRKTKWKYKNRVDTPKEVRRTGEI